MNDDTIRDEDGNDATFELSLFGHTDVEKVRVRIIGGLPVIPGARAQFVVDAVQYRGRWEEAGDE
jgi:hypothetical protein